MNDDELMEIVLRLTQKTEARQAKWGKTVVSLTYQLELRNSKVTVGISKDDVLSFKIFNSEGQVIERVEYERPAKGSEAPPPLMAVYRLYESAKESILRKKETLSDLKSEIFGDDIIGNAEDEIPF